MHILCVDALKLLSGFFLDKIWLFLVKTVWQPRVSDFGAELVLGGNLLGYATFSWSAVAISPVVLR